jgi:RND family efflux transporter MFP subunit
MKISRTLPVLAVLMAGTACARREAPEVPAPPAAKVHLAPSVQGAGEGWVAATLTSSLRATLSTRIAASVKQVHVNEGQQVAAGALLVSLSDEDLQSGLRAAQAVVAAAAAQHRRIEALIKQSAAIPAEMDQANTQLAQAQAAMAQVQANLGYTQVRAPFAGVIQTRMVNEGAYAAPGTPLVEMEGRGPMELDASVSEEEAKDLRIGSKVAFETDTGKGTAQITALAPGGDPVSHRGALRARVIQGGGTLRTGTFARIKLPGSAATGSDLLVPRSALVLRGELSGVFVANAGRAELHWLSLGEVHGSSVPVRAGLAPGLQVIDQPEGLTDGQPVEVLP